MAIQSCACRAACVERVEYCVVALSGFIDQMVHESVRGRAHAYARHSALLHRALILPIAAGLAAPLLVVFQGALPHAQLIVLGLCILPLAAIVLTQRAKAQAAHILLSLTWGMLACVFLQALQMPFAGSLCLVLAILEAAHLEAHRMRMMALLAGLACATAFTLRSGATLSLFDFAVAGAGLVLVAQIIRTLLREHARQNDEYTALLAEQKGFETLLAESRFTFSRSGAVRSLDQACAARFGLTRRDLSGRGFFERVQLADRPLLIKALGNALDGSEIQTIRIKVHMRDDESPRGRFVTPIYVTLDMRLKSVGEDEVMALVQDVSALVEAEEIVAAHRMAKIEDRDWKDRVLANVSHELRTPLNAIIGFSEMLTTAEPPNDAMRREYAQIIQTSGQHLLSVVNSVLDMSQMEAGALRLSREEFSFSELIDECCEMMHLQAQAAGVMLRRQLQRDAQNMFADKRACRQIVINLLSNAIKFTPQGGSVTVHAQQAGQDVLVAISDTGCGIAPEHVPHLGNPFFQARGEHAQAEGTGLGLSVVKGLVALHGGAMKIESALGQGTCVTFRLPLDSRSLTVNHDGATETSTPQNLAVPLPDMTMVKKIA